MRTLWIEGSPKGEQSLSSAMAAAVMPGGKVLAVDVQPEMVSLLQSMVRR